MKKPSRSRLWTLKSQPTLLLIVLQNSMCHPASYPHLLLSRSLWGSNPRFLSVSPPTHLFLVQSTCPQVSHMGYGGSSGAMSPGSAGMGQQSGMYGGGNGNPSGIGQHGGMQQQQQQQAPVALSAHHVRTPPRAHSRIISCCCLPSFFSSSVLSLPLSIPSSPGTHYRCVTG